MEVSQTQAQSNGEAKTGRKQYQGQGDWSPRVPWAVEQMGGSR